MTLATSGNIAMWRQAAEESRDIAQKLAWTAVVLFVAFAAALTYALSSQWRYAGMCEAISSQASASDLEPLRDFSKGVHSTFCG